MRWSENIQTFPNLLKLVKILTLGADVSMQCSEMGMTLIGLIFISLAFTVCHTQTHAHALSK